eukprot:CAMPEP_0181246710 /NCGR_PEP_ID=MMETSP1096-20121128/44155_1 /TAXON_ID=156174 ORGANISM="Chrysochromulina ericina, Strain CCMP281" /NCGR_SAMPLE_ID=MMETSP1096 /ASSEMBLY_ACC=CAM_ASM_000453 /LENGTH=32 /DNA_ID= /DNA_START= /DNA_END= /DNA_ORIENTATION=
MASSLTHPDMASGLIWQVALHAKWSDMRWQAA